MITFNILTTYVEIYQDFSESYRIVIAHTEMELHNIKYNYAAATFCSNNYTIKIVYNSFQVEIIPGARLPIMTFSMTVALLCNFHCQLKLPFHPLFVLLKLLCFRSSNLGTSLLD